jgi:DNA adenine methylase
MAKGVSEPVKSTQSVNIKGFKSQNLVQYRRQKPPVGAKSLIRGDTRNKPKRGFLSPFRYPGGKSWFVKTARKWLKNRAKPPTLLIEAFAGGAGVSLAAVNEGLVPKAAFAEIDRDVGAAWQCILNGEAQWLIQKITSFKIGRRKIERLIAEKPNSKRDRAFRCILLNRTARGGVMTAGAGLLRKGEDEKGIGSRWYPEELANRIRAVSALKSKLGFTRENGFDLIRKHLQRKHAFFFIDPPYTKAAPRLYKHWNIDHEELFRLLSRAHGEVLMTYDNTAEIRKLAKKYGFQFKRISMRTTHHKNKRELMISKNFDWQKTASQKTSILKTTK